MSNIKHMTHFRGCPVPRIRVKPKPEAKPVAEKKPEPKPKPAVKRTRKPSLSQMKPIEIHGVMYPSQKAAAEALGVSTSVIGRHKKNGTLYKVGAEGSIEQRMKPTTIRGVTYESRSEAARALGVSLATVTHHIRRGTLNRVGLSERHIERANRSKITK